MNLLTIALIFFGLAAMLGIVLITRVLKSEKPPRPMVFIHGLLAATGLAILAYYVINNMDRAPVLSLAILGLAALGGFTMLAFDLNKKQPPKAIAVIHALAAITGVLTLVLFITGM